MNNFILASASPRRRELLGRYIRDFKIIPADIDESLRPGEDIEEGIMRLAAAKAEAVASNHPKCVVIGADTLVVLDGKVYGKPKDAGDARRMLRELRGRTHYVITAVAVAHNGHTEAFADKAYVTFADYGDDVIEWYVNTGEPLDRAGAYAVQELGAVLAEKTDGDYNTVVGLPIARLMKFLCSKGFFSFE